MDINQARWIDLTHTLTESSPTWDDSCGFEHHIKHDYNDATDDTTFRVAEYRMPAGIGTHIDAPAHCFAGGKTIDALSLKQLIAPCICIDMSEIADENFLLTTEHIQHFEEQHQAIMPGNIVIIYTGWDKHWNDASRYRNHYQFPSISAPAADYLVGKDIAGVGIDTLSPDCPKSGFPVHQKILGHDKYIIENIAHADQLPPTGALLIALPMKVKDGTEAPLRLIAAY